MIDNCEKYLRKITELNNELITTQRELHRKNAKLEAANEELNAALAKIKKLENLLPVCAYCKQVKNHDGSWIDLDQYLIQNTSTKISHGVCAECLKLYRPDH